MYFDWDERKAESNIRKHGISFNEAVTVFADPYLVFTVDLEHSGPEDREWAIGETDGGLPVVVVFTMRGEQIRIISARPATKQERQNYESGL
ncbi:BrnT family toxin [Acaryochloris thomasi]|uniref:BrnT family toxin n=1 Tax=Acaryochloris thomasi TaxID=2929456 RepID=UPI000DA65CE9|nr:BrnT family toxin [Acaryochloris thomasi]